MQFQLIDVTNPTVQIPIVTSSGNSKFDVLIPINPSYSLIDLAKSIEINANSTLFRESNPQLTNSLDPRHMFMIDASIDPHVNPDRVTIKIASQANYKFTWNFFVQGALPTPIAKSIPASDAAFVVQNPDAIFPNPNSYAVDLDRAYTNIKSIRVISSEIPNTDTVVNLTNNGMFFRLIDKNKPPPTPSDPYSQNILTKDGSIDWFLYIPPADYTATELAAEIEMGVNNMLFGEAGLSNVFTVTANEKKGTFEINTQLPYAFYWQFLLNPDLRWRNLHAMLGFPVNFSSATQSYSMSFSNLIPTNPILPSGSPLPTTVIQVPFAAFSLRKSSIIWLQLNGYETIYDTLTQNKYFAMFTIDSVGPNQIAYDTFSPTAQVFIASPLTSLTTLDVRFYDETGLPYNFNNVDNAFTLEIVHHLDRFMGADYSSRRGVNDKTSYV